MSGEYPKLAKRSETAQGAPRDAEVYEDLDELRGALGSVSRALGTTNGRLDDVVRRMESLERDLDEVLGELRGFRAELAELRPALLATLECARRNIESEVTNGNH